MGRPKNTEVDFWKNVVKTDTCWNWIASQQYGGYGQFRYLGKKITAHRASFIIHNGFIDNNLMVLHSCHNSKCVNPSHLRLGTHKENMKDLTDANRQSKGENSHLAKLSEKEVKMIRQMKAETNCTDTKIAKIFGIARTTVCAIVNNQTWKHLIEGKI